MPSYIEELAQDRSWLFPLPCTLLITTLRLYASLMLLLLDLELSVVPFLHFSISPFPQAELPALFVSYGVCVIARWRWHQGGLHRWLAVAFLESGPA